ncbi:DUF4232 domain-containing protein [Streptomyces sp. NPDC087300]|uniref:DUF4232 domain-containing protein n=1 Tax=Streptomyces sp. NPDC087300 TaxID=3365780 RepID=UPI00380D0D87
MRTHRIRTAVLAATTATLALTVYGGSAGASAADLATAGKADTMRSAATTTATRACHGDELSYSVVHRFAKQQGEHLLITATNADSKPCWVTSYPSVMLGDTTKVLPHSAKDAPGGGTRVTLRPGAKVYSAVNLFTDSGRPHTSGDLSIALRDRTGDTGPATEQAAFDGRGVPSKFSWTSADVTHWNKKKPYDF